MTSALALLALPAAADTVVTFEVTAAGGHAAVPTVSLGLGVPTPSPASLALGVSVAYVGSGCNVVSWDPTLTFTLLPTQVAGTYQGTVTHSVS